MFTCLACLMVYDETEGRPGTHLPWYKEMVRGGHCGERWWWECGSYTEGQVDPMQRTGWRGDAVLFT